MRAKDAPDEIDRRGEEAMGLVETLYSDLMERKSEYIAIIHEPYKKMPWPGEKKIIWPEADIIGLLRTGEMFIIEVDETPDPCRSIIKYWPLFHAMKYGSFEHPKIRFFEVTKPNKTYGEGFHLLTQFIGKQLQSIYQDCLVGYDYINIGEKTPGVITDEICSLLH